jgi:SAM-dependent methyltransferase
MLEAGARPADMEEAVTSLGTADNVAAYRPWDFPLFRSEELVLARILRPGQRVLDVGCGNGRVTRHLVGDGRAVWAVDLNVEAVREGAEGVGGPGVAFAGADARVLPFRDGAFDVVVFAYNGIDFMATSQERRAALAEVGRVLAPGGWFLMSAHNPIGGVLTPRALRSPEAWKVRASVLRAAVAGRDRYRDADGVEIHHARPGTVIGEVRTAAGLAPAGVWATRSGRAGAAARVLSAWPTYLFRSPS